jgi:hypothetical protein
VDGRRCGGFALGPALAGLVMDWSGQANGKMARRVVKAFWKRRMAAASKAA